MTLDFEAVISLARTVKEAQRGGSLQDAEIAALQCAWDNIPYEEFVKEQKELIQRYSYLYRRPHRQKSLKSLPASSSKIMKDFSDYFQIERPVQSTFKRKILQLYNQGVVGLSNVQTTPETSDASSTLKEKGLGEELTTSSVEGSLFGRSEDIENILTTLDNKIIISLYGLSGVGKTYLLNYLIQYLKDDYRCFYTDFRYIDEFDDWIFDLISQINFEQELRHLNPVYQVLNKLSGQKNLIIIDSVGKLNDKFLSFIESIPLKIDLQRTRVIISSQNKVNFDIPEEYYCFYKLKGLEKQSDIHAYFYSLGLKDYSDWNLLCSMYEGNYRELKYVSKFINDFYEGHVSKYLETSSIVISPDLRSSFSSISLSQLDLDIFSVFSKGNVYVSQSIIEILKRESSSSEIFSRINHLADRGYLVRSETDLDGVASYSISPLLKSYLIQENVINA